MMASNGFAMLSILVLALFASSIRSEETETKEFVLTLDHSNFTDTINKHDFIVVEFYAPWFRSDPPFCFNLRRRRSCIER